MPLSLACVLSGHSDVVWCAAWAPSGKALATCGGDKQIRIWTAVTDADAETSGPPAATAADGASASGSAAPAAPIKFVCKQVLDGTHSRTVRSVSWSPSGKYLASAGFDGITAIWENQGGEFECIATLEGHENEVKCVAWSREGDLLATCSRDKSVWIWAAATPAGSDPTESREYECLSVLNGHTQDVKICRFHPTDGSLISASYDNTLKVWREEDDDWYCTETLQAHSSTVWTIAFDPTSNGNRMASASDDRSICLWVKGAASTTASTDENTLAASKSGSGWRVASVRKEAHARCIYSLDWSRQGKLASAGADDAICIWEPTAPATTIAATEAAPAAAASTAAGAPVSDSASGLTLLHTQRNAHSGDVNCVSWNPTNPSLLCSVGDDGAIKIWRFT